VDVSTTTAASRSSAVVGGSKKGWSVCWGFSNGRRSRVHTGRGRVSLMPILILIWLAEEWERGETHLEGLRPLAVLK
jgi:hypothetical protein